MIFLRPPCLKQLNQFSRNTLVEHLGIIYTAVGEDWLQGTMPVNSRTHQPYGLLHGGASVVLAETLGSMAGNLCVNPHTHMCVGLEVNANHVRSVRSGIVTGTARALHIGRSTHVWQIQVENESGKQVCISRLTLAAVTRDHLGEK